MTSTPISQPTLITEEDVKYLIQRFPSMNEHFKSLLNRLLSSYQNGEQDDDSDEESFNEDWDDAKITESVYKRMNKPLSRSPWFEIIAEEGPEGEFLIEAMIDKDGKEFLMKNIFEVDGHNYSILTFAAEHLSLGLVKKIVDIGGEDLVLKHKDALQQLLVNSYSFEYDYEYDCESPRYDPDIVPDLRYLIQEFIVLGGYSTLYGQYSYGPAIEMIFDVFGDEIEIVETVVSLVIAGGKDAIMRQDESYGRSILHYSIYYISIDCMKHLLHIGGEDLVFLNDDGGRTALSSCRSKEKVDLLLQIGGQDLVKSQNDEGNTFLHLVRGELEAYLEVLHIGGKEALMLRNQEGKSALHCMCDCSRDEEFRAKVIENFIQVGGKNLLRMKDVKGATALHYECSRLKPSLDVVKILLEESVSELGVKAEEMTFLIRANVETLRLMTPVQCLVVTHDDDLISNYNMNVDEDENVEEPMKINNIDLNDKKTAVLLHVLTIGIEHNVGGKYAIGGLFQADNTSLVHQEIFDRWFTVLLPAFKHQADLTSRQPLLEAAILAGAPSDVLLSIIEHIHYDCPTGDMKKRRLAINIAADFGIMWSKGMKEIAEVEYTKNGSSRGERDEESGFFPFMLAAKGKDSDLDAVFELTRRCPEVVKKFDVCIRNKRRRTNLI